MRINQIFLKGKCHYEGKLADTGEIFDSSIARGTPAIFAPNQVIPGWTEALQLMRPGDKWELTIPSELGYGRRGAGGKIPPNATLIFKLELIALNASKEWIEYATPMNIMIGCFILYQLYSAFSAMTESTGATKGKPIISIADASDKEGNKKVFFDISIGGTAEGRIVLRCSYI